MSVVDVIRGSDYQTRSLLLALRRRRAPAGGAGAGLGGGPLGLRGPARAAADGAADRDVRGAGRRGSAHPHALGMARLSSGAAAYLEGHFRVGLERLDEAEAIFREQCTGVIWELDTARIFGLWACSTSAGSPS